MRGRAVRSLHESVTALVDSVAKDQAGRGEGQARQAGPADLDDGPRDPRSTWRRSRGLRRLRLRDQGGRRSVSAGFLCLVRMFGGRLLAGSGPTGFGGQWKNSCPRQLAASTTRDRAPSSGRAVAARYRPHRNAADCSSKLPLHQAASGCQHGLRSGTQRSTQELFTARSIIMAQNSKIRAAVAQGPVEQPKDRSYPGR